MFRSIKSHLTAVLSLVLVALVAIVAPTTALAGGKKPPKPPKKPPHIYPHHHHHHPHFFGGVDVAIGGAGYVVADPIVNPIVSPTASQEVYTLYYKDAQGQAHAFGEFVATSYGSGVTDWGGLVEARDKLTASGLESWVRAGHASAVIADPTATGTPTLADGSTPSDE